MNTLLPWQEKRAYAQVGNACMMSKVQLLEDQFALAELDFVGVQEGRASASQSKAGHSYTMPTAPACEDGSLGVQLWVRFGIVVPAWEAFSPRLMFGLLCKRGVDFGVLVGHAPHSLASQSIRNAWWDTLSVTCSRLRTLYSCEWFVMLDANGRVGSVASPLIGPSQPEVENENGAQLRQFATDQMLLVANTWGPDAGYTWTSSKGTRSRIDYVLVPLSLEHQLRYSRHSPDTILTLNTWEDRGCVEFSVTVSTKHFSLPRLLPRGFLLCLVKGAGQWASPRAVPPDPAPRFPQTPLRGPPWVSLA